MQKTHDNERVAMRYIDNSKAAYSVDWYMTKRCNFDCSYCAEYLHDSHSESPSFSKMKRLVDIIEDKHFNNVLWSLTGGEPMVIPHFQEILQYIAMSNPRNISITTNGSVPTKKYIEAYDNGLDNITLSMHFEFIENREQEYLDRIIALEAYRKKWNESHRKDYNYKEKKLVARFMVYPGALEQVNRMYEVLKSADIEKIEFRNIRPQVGQGQDQMPTKKLDMSFDHASVRDASIIHENPNEFRMPKTYDIIQEKLEKRRHKDSKIIQIVAERARKKESWYSSEERKEVDALYKVEGRKALQEYFEDGSSRLIHYNELTFNRNTDFNGFKCWAGAMHMKIAPNGDIYVGSCHVGGKLGNILDLDDTFVLPSEPIICPKHVCTDNLDLRVPKALPGYEHLIENYVSKR